MSVAYREAEVGEVKHRSNAQQYRTRWMEVRLEREADFRKDEDG